jgi:hypothetical protein
LSVWPAVSQPVSHQELGQTDRARQRYAGRTPVQQRELRHGGRELRYGSREFRVASDLARRLPYSPPVTTLIGNVLRDPALIRVGVAIWRLPVVDLSVRRPDVDAWLGTFVGPVGRTMRNRRWAQVVLELPTVEEHYLAGRSKQALRTNLRHACKLGVTSSRIPTYEAWFEAASVVLRGRLDGPAAVQEMNEPAPGQLVAYYVARDADETPLAFARVALFGQFAVLFTMLSRLDQHPSASWARYQLHTLLALDLGRTGVRHLLVGPVLREPAGHQYFQHRLGYRIRNLRLTVIESGTGRSSGQGGIGRTMSRWGSPRGR